MIRMMVTAGAALAVLATAVLPTGALAADLPSKTVDPGFEPPPPIPLFSWTGFYAGIHAGYGFGRDRGALRTPTTTPATFGFSPNGILGGLHVGYNYALPTGGPSIVIGVEGDVDGADYQHTGAPFGALLAGETAATRSDIKGSIRGRVGFGVNRVLFYATGGAAFAEFDTRYNGTAAFGGGAFATNDRTRTGYTVGGGVEYAFLNYMSVRAEYRFTDYGTFVDPLGVAAPGLNASVSHRETDNRVQAGISYKFDSIVPAPVTARY